MKSKVDLQWALWVGALLSIPLACVLRNPLLLPWRGVATPLLLVAGVVALAILYTPCGQARPGGRQRNALVSLWLSVLMLVIAGEARFQWHKHQVQSDTSDAARALGAHVIIGYSHPEEARWLVQKGLVGGVFIGANTMAGKTAEAIFAEVQELQMLRRQAGLGPLVVSADQEGGIVSRLSPPLAHLPALADVIRGAQPGDIEALAFAYGQEHGRGLASVGVNVNFAPLADLSSPRERNRFDFHSLIGRRAIAADPHRVGPAVVGYAHGLEAHGVRATLKHFPGLGRVSGDTHLFRVALAASEADLAERDWIPFRAGLQATQSLLMVGHATLSTVDADRPASLSVKVVQGIVRDRWRHDGVIVTDDMAMAPVVRYGLCRAGVDAINAGVDLLLLSYDTDQYYTVMHCLIQAQRDGRLQGSALRRSGHRLDRDLGRVNDGIGK